MLFGYMGKILRINLSDNSIFEEETKFDDAKQFIGGSGLGAKYLFNETDEKTDPYDGENILIFLTGPLGNTSIPSSDRHSVIAKSPLTGIWGEADVGGRWGAYLKSAGYDGIIVSGKALDPVILYIEHEKVEIKSASRLWGKDTYEMEGILKKEFGQGIAISCIGIAGENLVKFASIMHDGKHGRAAGRCGLGAVMGSKKLKAIVVKRGDLKPPLFNHEELTDEVRKIIPKIKETRKEATLYGTSRSISPAEALGDLPIKNWRLGNWSEEAEKISGRRITETILTGKYSCYGCPVACGRVVKVSSGPFAPIDGAGYEYETGALFGGSCLIDNMEAIAKANELCNRYGMDTISTGGTIAFAMEAFEYGSLSEKETNGLKIEWGNPEVLLKLIELIAKRAGIGDILAEGSKGASAILGHGSSEFAIHVKNLELPGHDPRCFNGLGLGYATSNRGTCHVDSSFWIYEGRSKDPSLNILEPFDRLSSDRKGEFVAILQNFMALCDSLKICKFVVFGLQASDVHKWLNWVTGWNISFREFLKIGERIFNLKRLYNVKCGISRKDDTLPRRILTLQREGLHAPDKFPELDKMLNDYYLARGWDNDGKPQKEKITELNL